MKINYGNVIITGVRMPTWNTPRWVPVQITVTAGGVATVFVDGTNVFGNVVLPGYAPSSGRFGLYARTGGQTETHWLDDFSLTVLTRDTARGGQVTLDTTNNTVIYTPPTDACGYDHFYYIITDNQLGGEIVDTKTMFIAEANPAPPHIVSYVTNASIVVGSNGFVVLPDFASQVVATDNCCCITVSQSPAAGTQVSVGVWPVTITVSDAVGTAVQVTTTYEVYAYPPLRLTGGPAGTLMLTFDSVPGQMYRLNYRDNQNAPWSKLMDLTATATTTGFIESLPLLISREYRVEVLYTPPVPTPPALSLPLNFQVEPGKLYRLQYSVSLDTPVWTDVGPQLYAASDRLSILEVTAADPQRFYRLIATTP
jgi:hypothetical protein